MRTSPTLSRIAAVAGLLLAWACAADGGGSKEAGDLTADRSLVDLSERAGFIFEGTVQEVAASNVGSLPAGPGLAVVVVDRILERSKGVGDFTGLPVTVQLSQPGSLFPGDRRVFFTNTWIFAENLAVREVGNTQAAVAAVDLALDAREDKRARERLGDAIHVVTGTVVAVDAPAWVTPPVPSEHSPDWRQATVRVRRWLGGEPTPARPEVSFLFATSLDVSWYTSPKFERGQTGVWLLRRSEIEGMAGEVLWVVDPDDFVEILPAELDTIRDLVDVRGRLAAR